MPSHPLNSSHPFLLRTPLMRIHVRQKHLNILSHFYNDYSQISSHLFSPIYLLYSMDVHDHVTNPWTINQCRLQCRLLPESRFSFQAKGRSKCPALCFVPWNGFLWPLSLGISRKKTQWSDVHFSMEKACHLIPWMTRIILLLLHNSPWGTALGDQRLRLWKWCSRNRSLWPLAHGTTCHGQVISVGVHWY